MIQNKLGEKKVSWKFDILTATITQREGLNIYGKCKKKNLIRIVILWKYEILAKRELCDNILKCDNTTW